MIDSAAQQSFWSFVDKGPHEHGCWHWIGGMTTSGYGHYNQPGGRQWKAHRFAFYLAYGPFNLKLFVLHKCDNPMCVRPAHLFLGTAKDNVQDMIRKHRDAPTVYGSAWNSWMRGDRHWRRRHPERVPKGSQTGRAKLTEAKVLDIRKRNACGETKASLAREFKVSEVGIYNIVKRISWTHIP